jgi:hypothetical protein
MDMMPCSEQFYTVYPEIGAITYTLRLTFHALGQDALI